MPFFQYKGIRITGIAAAVPTEKVKATDFYARYGEETVDKFMAMTGIEEFRRTKPHQTASDLGYAAAEKLLNGKKIDRDSIGALIFTGLSPDYRRPATACILHKRLELSKECAAFDVGLGCSAITYSIQNICSMMSCSDIQRALLIVGETSTKMVNPNDRSVSMLFGDAGAAMLFERDESAPDISVLLKTDGTGYRTLIAPAGGFRNLDASHEDMTWPDGNVRSLYNTYMNGTDVFTFSITDVPKSVKEFIEKTGNSIEFYDCFAFHQANRYILRQLSKKLKIPTEKMPLCMARYGNTSAPGTALALCDAYGDKQDMPLRTMFCCFGIGLSWGVASALINADDIYPVFETDEIFEEGIINEPF